MLRFQCLPSSVSQKSRKTDPPPTGSPKGAELPVSSAFFDIFLKFLIKSLLIKEIFTPLSKALGKERPTPTFPKTGSLWKQTPISRALLSMSFGVPSRGALPTGSPHKAPREKGAPFPGPSFIRLSKSLVNEAPSRFSVCEGTSLADIEDHGDYVTVVEGHWKAVICTGEF
jgi:hypothetical protein